MNKTMTSLLLVGVLGCNLVACSTAATTATLPGKAEEVASCRETGLTDGKDSRMGQVGCTPRTDPAATSAK